jgi:hypothetical protein
MLPVEIAPGLWRWTAAHPAWDAEAEAGGPMDWEQKVASALYEIGDTVAVIDPLLPSEGREAFLRWLDERVGGRPVSVLTTIRWHRRDRAVVAERYRSQSGARAWNMIPAGVVPRRLRGAGETPLWLPGVAALVVGDCLLGDGGGGLQLCPESWLEHVPADRRRLATLLEPLLDLSIERVLTSHGEPVRRDARAALARAIEQV